MYLFGKPGWDSGITPPEVVEEFEKNDVPPGTALDLGCGTGTNVITLARLGRQAIGVDFVPEAISRARRKAQKAGLADRTQFYVGDVTRLDELLLPPISFALDMGCFHGLNADGRAHYVESLARLMPAGGRFMLYTLDPNSEGGVSFGMSPEQVRAAFSGHFDIVREERGSFWKRGSTWFWMVRKV
jgi:cyclopropane fatty-acyl-phospholipid synthase-like methyltransferase